MLNLITMMSMAAISGLIDNTTFYHFKNLRLVLLSGTVIVPMFLRRLGGCSGLLLQSSSLLEFSGMKSSSSSSFHEADGCTIVPPAVTALTEGGTITSSADTADTLLARRGGGGCRFLPCARTDSCMLCASAQHGSNNVSAS